MNDIRLARNQSRFKDKNTHWKSYVSIVTAHVAFSSNSTLKTVSNSMVEFNILKKFKFKVQFPNIHVTKEFLWHHPPLN